MTDPLPSMDYVSGSVYQHQFETQHYQLLSFLSDMSLISSFNGCGICNSEQTPLSVRTN